MQPLLKHIVLIGFKHAGKSVIGASLAKELHLRFIDLDKKIEALYEDKTKKDMTCRAIMQIEGEKFFRQLEIEALSQVVKSEPSVISLGGGTPLYEENQRILKSCILIHITAPKGVIYERILMSGRPAFVKPGEDLFATFNQLWNERIRIYERLENFSICNDSSIQDSVEKITKKLTADE